MLQLTVIGNLGADAEVKRVNGSQFVSFNVAHTDRWTDENGQAHEQTQWVGCTINGDGGNLLQYLTKGTTVYAVGRVRTRVYSSEKARAMVAGLDLRVQHIELVGARPDTIPSRLYTQAGVQVDVSKHYWTHDVSVYGCVLYDRQARQYSVDNQGWVSAIQQQAVAPAENAAASDDGAPAPAEPTAEEPAPESETKKKSHSK